MTEEEAKTKWCPFARVVDRQVELTAAANRWYGNAFSSNSCCIGSACMAWRWDGWVNIMDDGSLELNEQSGQLHLMPFRTLCKNGCVRVGRCGLAGKP